MMMTKMVDYLFISELEWNAIEAQSLSDKMAARNVSIIQ